MVNLFNIVVLLYAKILRPAMFVTSPMHCLSLLQAMDGGGGRRRVVAKSSAEDQALDQIAKEVSVFD